MATRFPIIFLLLIAAPLLASAATPTANLTDILVKNGAFQTFLKLLNSTQVLTQIQNQLNTSTEGMTVFAPTDNAFSTLKAGTLNSLTTQNQVQLVLYHVLPKFYNWDSFQTVSNPVQTQASGNNGNWGLNIVAYGVQNVNVSTGVVETQLNNALSQKMPLAVYQVEKVLLPEELFGTKAKSPAKAPATASDDSTKSSNSTAKSSAAEPTAADKEKNGASGLMMRTGGGLFGLVLWVVATVL